MRRSDGQSPPPGEVTGAAQVSPEGGVCQRLRVQLEVRHRVEGDALAPVGSLCVEIGQLGCPEGGADTAPQLLIDGPDDPVGLASLHGSLEGLESPPTLLPLEEGVLERIAHHCEVSPPRPSGGGLLGDVTERAVERPATAAWIETAIHPPDRDGPAVVDRRHRPLAPQPDSLR